MKVSHFYLSHWKKPYKSKSSKANLAHYNPESLQQRPTFGNRAASSSSTLEGLDDDIGTKGKKL